MPNPAAILAFERRFYARPGSKEQAILDTFGLSTTRYYQRLNRLLDDPASLAIDAPTVRRLQRVRAQRHAARV